MNAFLSQRSDPRRALSTLPVSLINIPAGRIILHMLAMIGDGCVRFHMAGIARELPVMVAIPRERSSRS